MNNKIIDIDRLSRYHENINTLLATKQESLVSGDNIKTINGTSLLGSGDIVISGGGGDYLPLTGGTITGDLTLTDGPGGAGNFQSYTVISNEFFSDIYYLERNGEHAVIMGNNKVEIINGVEQTKASIDWSGDGTKFLSNDGTYKTISGGGSSDANIQAVDTGDVIDDVNVDYATKTYVDGLVGDINSVLESIINGGVSLITFTINGTEYQAEEGMTWGQWVDSEYNTSTWATDGESVYYNKMFIEVIDGVTISDIILNNGVYSTKIAGGAE